MPSRSDTLDELVGRITYLMDEIDDYDRDAKEPPKQLVQMLETCVEHAEDKVDAIVKVIRRMENAASDCEEEASSLRSRAYNWKRRRKSLEGYVLGVMSRCGWKKLEGARGTLTKIAGREKVSIDNLTLLPAQFKRASFTVHVNADLAEEAQQMVMFLVGGGTKYLGSTSEVEVVPDKQGIKLALEQGEVPGASTEVGPATLRAYIARTKAEDDAEPASS
jgi:hypothetical protein